MRALTLKRYQSSATISDIIKKLQKSNNTNTPLKQSFDDIPQKVSVDDKFPQRERMYKKYQPVKNRSSSNDLKQNQNEEHLASNNPEIKKLTKTVDEKVKRRVVPHTLNNSEGGASIGKSIRDAIGDLGTKTRDKHSLENSINHSDLAKESTKANDIKDDVIQSSEVYSNQVLSPEVSQSEKAFLRRAEKVKINSLQYQADLNSSSEKLVQSTNGLASNIFRILREKKDKKIDSKEEAGRSLDPIVKQSKEKNSMGNSVVKRTDPVRHTAPPPTSKVITIPNHGITARELAAQLSMKLVTLVSKLQELGLWETGEDEKPMHKSTNKDIDADNDKYIDADSAELFVLEMNSANQSTRFVVTRIDSNVDEKLIAELSRKPSSKEGVLTEHRPPTISIMGHVDHGKTTLLDRLRKASKESQMAGKEAGGITQKLSAFCVTVDGATEKRLDGGIKDRKTGTLVFLDTPGHVAFSCMRTWGAAATDIVVLVVALDDGVRPQTIESVKTALAANCTIIIALNKVDKFQLEEEREAARVKVLTQLLEFNVVAEQFGGDVLVVEISGKSGQGVDRLIDSILLQAELLELRAAPQGPAEAIVIDASTESGLGVVADVLIKWGSLKVGDHVIVGTDYGKVKRLVNTSGKSVQEAKPSEPVRLIGLKNIPTVGEELISVSSDARARQLSERRMRVIELRSANSLTGQVATQSDESESPSTEVVEAPPPVLNLILKADFVGSLEALKQIVSSTSQRTSSVKLNVLDGSVGDITQSDVERINADGEVLIVGFNSKIGDASVRRAIKELQIPFVSDSVIYRLEEVLIKRMEECMPFHNVYSKEGTAQVLKVFEMNDRSKTVVAGLLVKSGKLLTSGRSSNQHKARMIYRVVRDEMTVFEESEGGPVLKRFKDTVHEVEHGHECGLSLNSYNEFMVNDTVECYTVSSEKKKLDLT